MHIVFGLLNLNLLGGDHTIKVKARATGYTPSDFSNIGNYRTIFFQLNFYLENKGSNYVAFRTGDNDTWYSCPANSTRTTYNNWQNKVEVVCEATPGTNYVNIYTDTNKTDLVISLQVANTTSNPLDITQYLRSNYYIEIIAND